MNSFINRKKENLEEKKDYGKTLNLPKTDFPMRGNLPENEPKIFEEVFQNDLYEKMSKAALTQSTWYSNKNQTIKIIDILMSLKNNVDKY